MRRRFTASGKPRKSASPASAKTKRRPRPKTARRPADAAAGQSEPERLRRELNEALERETATAEILTSIRESTSDTRPVFETILDNLLRLFGTRFALILLVRDGMLHVAGIKGEPGFEKMAENFPAPLNNRLHAGKSILAGRALQIVPVIGNPEAAATTRKLAVDYGYNALLSAPLIHGGTAIGSLSTAHRNPTPFTEKQIALIKSFADQAVIAIENTRLLNELRESLEQQTATADVLKVISSSPADLEPVFQSMLENAVRICDANFGTLFRYDNEAFDPVAISACRWHLSSIFSSGAVRFDRYRAVCLTGCGRQSS